MPNSPLIPANWSDFPDEFRDRLGSSVGRQRCMVAANQLLIVAHHVPEHDEHARRGLLFWMNAQGEWRASNGDPGKAALQMHLDRYAKRVDAYEAEETRAQTADDYLKLLDGLVPIVRSAKNLLATLEEARKEFPKERSLIDHRDRAYDISRQVELLYEDSKNAMEVTLIRRADEQTAVTHRMAVAAHRLNLLAAVFLPLATLGSIFGTTLTDNWSWSKTPLGFACFVISGIVLGLALARFVSTAEKK